MVGMRRLALVALLAVSCGSIVAHAQTLALAYRAGDTYTYALHLTSNMNLDAQTVVQPINLDLTGKETVTVRSVDASGAADLSITVSNLAVKTVSGTVTNTTTGSTVPAVEMKVAADGRILSLNGTSFGAGGLPQFGGLGGSFISAVLPDGSVKPGDTWSKNYDQANPVGIGSVHVTTKSKYLRNESVKGVSAAVVETTSTATIDITIDLSKMVGAQTGVPTLPDSAVRSMIIKGATDSDVTTWVDPGGHRVVKSHMTANTNTTLTVNLTSSAPIPGLTGPISIRGAETMDLTPA
jgi:hypothetical protein